MTAALSRLRREEEGWALFTALTLMVVMLGIGVGTYGYVDGQTDQSRVSRVKESAFNLAEAAMNAQIFQLARDWPGKGAAANPYPSCTQSSTATRCPSATQLRDLFSSPDVDAAAGWTTAVRDNNSNATQNFYSDEQTKTAPGYDANGDGKMWVRAEATAKGRKRTLIALVRAQEVAEDLPRGAVISGRLSISNMGHKVIIDAQGGGSTESGIVAVRCTPKLLETVACLGHPLGSGPIGDALGDLQSFLNFQISPNVAQVGYGYAPAMTAEARARMKAAAIANGTYYASGCPTLAGLAGQIVYIENGNCAYTSNGRINTASAPGMILMARGSFYLGGTSTYHGILYHANEAGSTGNLVQVQGNATIEGGVLVDGDGTTIAGSSKLNVRLDPNAYNAVKSYGSVGIVQNTWREIRSQ